MLCVPVPFVSSEFSRADLEARQIISRAGDGKKSSPTAVELSCNTGGGFWGGCQLVWCLAG